MEAWIVYFYNAEKHRVFSSFVCFANRPLSREIFVVFTMYLYGLQGVTQICPSFMPFSAFAVLQIRLKRHLFNAAFLFYFLQSPKPCFVYSDAPRMLV